MRNNRLTEYGNAAASLCNDWRDTIFYTGLAAGAIGNVALGWGIPTHDFAFAASQREFGRVVAWYCGNNPNPYHKSCAIMAAFAAWSTEDILRVSESILNASNRNWASSPKMVAISLCMDAVGLSISAATTGGPKAVVKKYRDTLFDWPRKNKPPGHRNVLKDDFLKLADWVRDAITPPRPAWAGASFAAGANPYLVPSGLKPGQRHLP